MNFIFGELKILKEQQTSDFHATMLALSVTRDTTRSLSQNVDTLSETVGSLSNNLQSVEAAMAAQHRTSVARLEKLEEAVHLLDQQKKDKDEAS